jgi:hypothetical protein
MAQAPESSPPNRPAFLQQPWLLVLAGLGTTILGLLLLTVPNLEPPRVILTGIGVILAGLAVARRLQTAADDLEERVVSAGVVVASSLTAMIAYIALQKWDSARMFFGVLFGVGLAGSVLVLLPSLGRRIVLSVLVVLHFGCIVTAVTLVPPRNEAAPWLSMQLWARFYRPYMSFMYLTNAYHFYAPDPGPANLLRFYIEYSDGTIVKLPELPQRPNYKLNVQYQRMLALTEFASNQGPQPLSEEQIPFWEKRMRRPYEHDSWQTIVHRRRLLADQVPALRMVDDVLPNGQYVEPSDESKQFLRSYARHLALTTPPPPDHPEATVKSIRIYRVVHNIIRPRELAEGHSPDEPTYYWPFYMGKFDPSGKLLDPRDPCLYWLLPITYVNEGYPEDKSLLRINNPPSSGRLLDCVEIHARQRSPED